MDPNTTDKFTAHVLRTVNPADRSAVVSIATSRGTAYAALQYSPAEGGMVIDAESVKMPDTMPKVWRGLLEDLAHEEESHLVWIDADGIYSVSPHPMPERRIPIPVRSSTLDRYGGCNVDLNYHGTKGFWIYESASQAQGLPPRWTRYLHDGLADALTACANLARDHRFTDEHAFVYLHVKISGDADLAFDVSVPV